MGSVAGRSGGDRWRMCLGSCHSTWLWATTGLDDPRSFASKKLGSLNYVQESARSNQPLEIEGVVAAKFLIFEVYPEPRPRAAVVYVKCSRFGISRHSQEEEQRFRKLDPSGDCRVFGYFKQSGHSLLQRFANCLSLLVGISDWSYIHRSKHQSSPFSCRCRTWVLSQRLAAG